MKLSEIARRLGCELQGDDKEITAVCGIETAGPADLTFVSNPKYVPYLKTTRAGAVILGPDAREVPLPALRTPQPYLAFARAIELFYQPPRLEPGVHPAAVIHPRARLAADVSIGAHTVVQEGVEIERGVVIHPNCTLYPFARIGEETVIHAGAVIREYVRIGRRCVIQNGVVIGGDGFGFAPRGDGSYHKIVQSGIVVLEDDVEVGANSTIDRAAVGETRIRAGVKIDNLVQVGHGCEVGEHTVLAAQVGLAGSTRVGRNAVLAGQVGAAGHQQIGDRVTITAQSGVHGTVEAGSTVSGSPAFDTGQWRKATVIFARLPELQRRLRELEKLVHQLLHK